MMRWLLLLVFACLSPPALAQSVVADISAHVIEVTTGFTGADMIVFGSMDAPADVAVVIEGPPARATVRKKSRIAGIWANTESFVFDDVPGYYAIATSRPAEQMASAATLAANKLRLDDLAFPVRDGSAGKIDIFHEALLQRREARAFYLERPDGVTILSDKLFRTTFHLPSNVPIGEYKVHIFLLHDGAVNAIQTIPFKVDETGLSATIFQTSKQSPLLYALAALLLSIVMGGGGAWLFHKVS